MNRTLKISVIVSVAVIMGMSAVAPMIPEAYAHDVPEDVFAEAHTLCFKVGLPENIPEGVSKLICDH